jgi:hypothetical protein
MGGITIIIIAGCQTPAGSAVPIIIMGIIGTVLKINQCMILILHPVIRIGIRQVIWIDTEK